MPVPKNNNTTKKLSIKDKIYLTMREWIIEGVLTPGERLLEDELCEHFNVSRTPIREAIQLLEIHDFVRIFPGRGTIVSNMDYGSVRSCYQPLMVLQKLAAELACDNITNEQMEQLKKLNAAFRKSKAVGDIKPIINADDAFHNAILHIAGNESIINFSAILCSHIRRAEYQFVEATKENQQNILAHEEIIAALGQRDKEKAGHFMFENWRQTMVFFEDILLKLRNP